MNDHLDQNTQMKTPLLRCVNLKKSFFKEKQEIQVIKGVDLTIYSGELVSITGASGVGKSTLLHLLGTLEAPTEGHVYFGPKQQDVFQFSERALSHFRNRALGFIFQFHYLLPEFTALENVMMPALIAGHMKRAAKSQAEELLSFVGLEHRLNHRPSELSGGEQQRIAIARAVILRPKILLADELTGNLDSENSKKAIDLLIQLNQTTGIAIMLVTHDQSLANQMHRKLVMRDGILS